MAAALAAISSTQAALALLTGPLQARALSPDGRGELAAIIVPLTLGPIVFSLSVGAYASVQAARNKPAGEIVGSLGAVLLLIGLLVAGASPLIAGYLADGREDVERMLTVGLALMPLSLVGVLLVSMLGSLGMWRALYAVRLIPIVGGTAAIVALYLLDLLTVTSAALASIVVGLVALIPSVAALRGGGRMTLRLETIAAGVGFGARAWVGSLAALANARLDQLLMVRLASTTELGLYAVAVTLATLPLAAASSLGPPLVARVAGGDHAIATRSVRSVLALTGAVLLPTAVLTPLLLPFLFGDEFRRATEMCLVLMTGTLPLVGVVMLGPILVGLDRPSAVSFAELLALVTTVAGIIVLVPSLGGLGAAIVTSAASWLNFGALVWFGKRRLAVPIREFCFADKADIRNVIDTLAALGARGRDRLTNRRRDAQ